MKKFLIILTFLLFLIPKNLLADTTYFVDFSYILNQSKAGKEAQDILKKKIKTSNEKFSKQEKKILDDEKDLISKKNVLKGEEYKKKVSVLRDRVAKVQKEKRDFFAKINKQRSDSRKQLLKSLTPIMQNYMKENNIKIIIDKKNVLLGDASLDITKKITELLNKELKSLNLN
tara:strand:- start:1720 stop:2238 length:519 start_codon:yes stop_codon:yes gene_type:complete